MEKTITQPTFTDAERKLINNFCADGERSKGFGFINVKRYLGLNTRFAALNGTAKSIGTASYVKSEGVFGTWYVDAIDGERYRIPEPELGIEAVLDLEFKRKDV